MRCQHLGRIFRVLHHQRFGDLELQRLRRDAGARDHRLHVVDEVVAQQLAARYVDRDEGKRRGRKRVLPGGELARGVLQHVEAELHDQAALLRGGDEFLRRDASVQRMLPARERLEAGDRIVLKPHDRLVDDVDVSRFERLAELGVEVDAAAAHAEGRLVELDVVAAVALRLIDGRLGAADLLLRRSLVGRRRDADRGRQEDVAGRRPRWRP